MEHNFKIEFFDDGKIEVTSKESGDKVILRYYDDDPFDELYLTSLHCGPYGIPFSDLEDFVAAAGEELTIREHFAEEEAPATRLSSELAELHKWNAEGRKLSKVETFEFFHDRDVEILSHSPADFFRPLDMNQMSPDTWEESTGAQFFQPAAEAEEQIPNVLRKQAETLYETKYSFRLGYPILLLDAPREEYKQTRLASYPDNPSGILFLDRSHIYGIIQFPGLKQYFATYWKNTRRGPQFPQLYCGKFGKMLLVKKFALNENDELIDPFSQDWYAFFNIGPNLVIREYRDFLRKAKAC